MKQLLCILFLLLSLSTAAQNCLTIHQKDGQTFSYQLREKPVITYSGNDFILTSEKVQVSFPVRSLALFTFEDIDTSVRSVDKVDADCRFSENTVWIRGASPESTVLVCSMDGKVVKTLQTSIQGDLRFGVDELPEGLYAIRTENASFKILKR